MKPKAKHANLSTKRERFRVAGKLREIVTIRDFEGKVIHRFTHPLMLEFYLRDAIQVMVGAAIMAIPVGFTEEVWSLGGNLPLTNIAIIGVMSIAFIGIFVFYNYYRPGIKGHVSEFIKRVTVTYALSLIVVAALLTTIDVAPWQTDMVLAMNRVIIVSLPASLGAAVVDMIK